MSHIEPGIFVRHDPLVEPVPVIFDSPHSGADYPVDFSYACSPKLLRQAEDAHVDRLFSAAPETGATLIAALFPRSYIDVNRAVDDIDPQLLDVPWPGPVSTSDRARVGMGLVRRVCRPGLAMYDRKLSVPEITHRIDRYYRPYHAAVADAIEQAVDRFGAVWHVNCHSMPSSRGPRIPVSGWERADFVLGDRDGTTCGAGFRRLVQGTLQRMGYDVRINDPYKGVELVRRFGQPHLGRHSLQIEVNRRLYMNEETLEPNAGFERLKRDIDNLVAAIAPYARDELMAAAAD
ncbi:MAG: putative hydrolase [Rhodospirillales bacterium]|nr:putative hydrolase [Rhodospirillales bacterium]